MERSGKREAQAERYVQAVTRSRVPGHNSKQIANPEANYILHAAAANINSVCSCHSMPGRERREGEREARAELPQREKEGAADFI